ncbi:MAG: hypothetical protein K2K55_01445 [Duncaniella sp.]|nr:hypothetical protein [Duncaniella sp.]
MNFRYIRTLRKLFLPAVLSVGTIGWAQTPQAAADEEEIEAEDSDDLEQQEYLASPVVIPDDVDDIDIPIPSFIHRTANHIIYNGADWSRLRQAVLNSTNKPVNIVHIGDSHIQADISTSTTRRLLQYDFGNAGRGLISPLKISGTNQPTDFTFSSHGSWSANKLMSQSWRQTVGFTGCSIRPHTSSSSLTIATCSPEDYDPFRSVTIFHSGRMQVTSVEGPDGEQLKYRAIPSKNYTQILLNEPVDNISVRFNSAGDLTVFGASLSGDRAGLFYHNIGNNGATYSTYNRIGNVGEGISPLSPDLVILSLGTNEAFGRLDTSGLRSAIDRLVKNIKASNPNALILLTTPMECHKAFTTTKKTRVRTKATRKRKARYRTVNKTVRTYSVNPNIAPIRDAILAYGKQNGIAVYDWYEVAGGRGASNTWISHDLFAKDRVHHTRTAYNIEGRLLYEALLDALRNP